MQSLAPIALFAYNRLDHLKATVESLQHNPESQESVLYVFCDGPKEGHEAAVDSVKNYVQKITGFKRVIPQFTEKNQGLANAIINGVGKVLAQHQKVIVLEDDLVLSQHFLKFMNEGLIKYQTCDKVASIHGYSLPTTESLPSNYFLKGTDCWGWATWRDRWQLFEVDGQALLNDLKRNKLTHQFDFDGLVPNTRMLMQQIKGKNNSWAIRWHASMYLKNKLTLFPGTSLVKNIGTDASGAHCQSTDMFETQISIDAIPLVDIPVEESQPAREIIKDYYRAYQHSILDRILNNTEKVLRSVYGKKTTAA